MDLFLNVLLEYWFIIFLFFIISIIYSSVGFGGGSSYLAILAFTSLSFYEMRATALLCNILVVVGNFIHYYNQKLYDWKKVIPIIIFSIPFAFLGGYFMIKKQIFFIILGLTLIFAAFLMIYSTRKTTKEVILEKNNSIQNSFFGGIIGFLSGLVGIGGGIFLAPLLHLSKWDSTKKIAATASLFILVNSIAGLVGQSLNPNFKIDFHLTFILLLTVFLGGKIGIFLQNKLLPQKVIKILTATLILYVGLKIIFKI